MVFKKSRKVEKEETPITEEETVEAPSLGEIPELNLPENLGNLEEEPEEEVEEEAKEEVQEELKEEPKKEITVNDVMLDHEKRILQIESRLFRNGGI